MSRSDKNIPYPVAYQRVTGREESVNTTDIITADQLLSLVRDGENFRSSADNTRYVFFCGNHYHYCPGQGFYKYYISPKVTERIGSVIIYPNDTFTKDDRPRIIPTPSSVDDPSRGFVTPDDFDTLTMISRVLGTTFHNGDIPLSIFQDKTLIPFTLDGETVYLTCRNYLVMENNDPFTPPLTAVAVVVTLHRLDEDIEVTTVTYDGDVTRNQWAAIKHLVFSRPPHDLHHQENRRRARERDVLTEMVKEYNTYQDIEDSDDGEADIPTRVMDRHISSREWMYW